MKLNHIINIGYPKCGTTWCWEILTQQNWFSYPREKENNDLLFGIKTVDQYILDYNNYNISANFCPNMFGIDRYLICLLHEISTLSVSIILRNPFELYWSLYNFLDPKNITFLEHTENWHSQGWWNQTDLILARWMEIFPSDRFKIFFYEDLQSNPTLFFENYCDQMHLPEPIILNSKKVNATRYKHTNSEISTNLVDAINWDIDRLQTIVSRDISHWKR